MKKSSLLYVNLLLVSFLYSCEPGNVPVPLHIEPSPAAFVSGDLPAATILFSPFYATYQASANYRLAAISASIIGNPKADSSALKFVYQGKQLIDKKLRPVGSTALVDLPRRLTFNPDNQLITDEAAVTSISSQTGTYGNARTEYTYEGNAVKRAIRYTVSPTGTLVPAVDVTYTYLNGRYNSAVIKSFVSPQYPYVSAATQFTLQRTYSYSADGRSLTIADNGRAVIIDAKLDERGTILFEEQRFPIAPEGYLPVFLTNSLQDANLYPHKAGTDWYDYVYDGPDGLISEVYNRSRGIRYRFIYQPN
ncbi:hypothetical protein [uncultured Fibrella sp.]|uniref:hypothetical protein n=1 Tax=uncultured Fibrella sp. TaxID=1284596 RepID=UPI0035CBB633